jgi:hypothetical protein
LMIFPYSCFYIASTRPRQQRKIPRRRGGRWALSWDPVMLSILSRRPRAARDRREG